MVILSARKRERLSRRVVGVMSALLALAGVAYLLGGDLTYPNYWGGRVFTPVAIAIGLLGLFVIGVRTLRRLGE